MHLGTLSMGNGNVQFQPDLPEHTTSQRKRSIGKKTCGIKNSNATGEEENITRCN